MYASRKPVVFSVIVNTCNRFGPLRTLLYALNRQTYPHFEVLVVVGPTTDNTLEMLRDEFPDRVVLVHCAEYNLSMSRNDGIAQAVGDVIVFIDDDALPALTWLEQLAAAYADPDVAAVGGQVHHNVLPGEVPLNFRHGLVSNYAHFTWRRSTDDVLPPVPTPGEIWYPQFVGTNMSFRRDALLEIGGFDEHFVYLLEDPDMSLRMALAGKTVMTLSHATVYHAPATSPNRKIGAGQKFVLNTNWYLEARGFVYFTLKTVRRTGGTRRALRRASEFAQGIVTKANDFLSRDLITAAMYPDVRRQIRRGHRWGYFYGALMPRRIRRRFGRPERPFKPFLKADSARYPNVYPLPVLKSGKVSAMEQEPLRICLLSEEYPPSHTDGIARSTYMLARGLSALGHEVHVVKRGEKDACQVDGSAYVHQIQPVPRTDHYRQNGYHHVSQALDYSYAVNDFVYTLEIDHRIQLVDSPMWHFEGLVTAVAGQLPVVVRPVTSIRQLIEIQKHKDADLEMLGYLEEALLQHAAGIAPNSTATMTTLEQLYGINWSEHQHCLTHYGIVPVDESEVLPLNLKSQSPIVLFLGRLEQRKGILDLFQAIPQVLKEIPQARFWFAGKDNSAADGFQQEHGLDYPSYFARKYPQLRSKVEFLGFVDDKYLARLYQTCSLFVAPSLYESFGLVYLEAMNHARATIGCNVGGPVDIISHGETGYLVPPETPNALASAVVQALAAPDRLSEMGLAGRQRLLDQFTHIKMAERFVELYQRLLAGS
jgi:glycogen(starch) synthase